MCPVGSESTISNTEKLESTLILVEATLIQRLVILGFLLYGHAVACPVTEGRMLFIPPP